jgi:chromosome segregation ATPase
MNHPTREEFERLEEEVRKLKEQRTEEMKVVKVEVASEDVLKRLDTFEHGQKEISQRLDEQFGYLSGEFKSLSARQDEQFAYLKGELQSLSARQNEYDKGLISHSRSIGTLQNEMKEARADIIAIKDSQADLRDSIIEIKGSIIEIKGSIKEIKGSIKEIKDTMATKEDISALKGDISTLKKDQDEQHDMLRQILRILGQR